MDETDPHEGERCVLKDLAEAMYATVERRPGLEHVRAVILLSDPGLPGHESISVFGYSGDHVPQRVIEDMTMQLSEFAETFGEHVDVYVNGMRLTTGRASPTAS